ncbi:aspartyl-phosphate phosphatase Spo0E family protein [Bacillus salacetis]|uniref:aspartyl-phosphate phosphatase Spo0E family protein n=1 Tax=Bacillus salacetis TaxID=2315464 RepID=UPI003BA27883
MRECEIHKRIEETRSRLFRSASQNGMNSETTIKISQELDILINYIQRKQITKGQMEC